MILAWNHGRGEPRIVSRDCGENVDTAGCWPCRAWTIGAEVVEPVGAEPGVEASLGCWFFKVASWASRSRMRCWLEGSGADGAGSQDCMIWATSLAMCWVASFCWRKTPCCLHL